MADPEITPELVAAHGLTPDEYARIEEIIGRPPGFTELGIFSAMWNEHCSYKSSKKWLRSLPVEGKQVIHGPGENAGVIDIGDGDALAFKMESHNHPSQLEPFHGAATGVGGILRDVFTMGARPIAAMAALSFGDPGQPHTAELLQGALAGIADYATTFGVPAVGGELRFHRSYDGNCLVNAFAAGLVRKDAIFTSAASGVGMPLIYLGGRTGREGVGGATMASAEFGEGAAADRPEAQVGDPDLGRRLFEACMELMNSGAVIAVQDMGAAGLTCSAVEMGDKGGLGVRLELDRVPVSAPGMSAYEMMLSESQERMLLVLRPEAEAHAQAIAARRGLEFAVVGETIAEDRFLILHGNEVKADLPLSRLASSAPEYDRPHEAPPAPAPLGAVPEVGVMEGLRALLASPNYGARTGVWQRLADPSGAKPVVPPGLPAGVVAVPGRPKLLAFTADVTPRYVAADPVAGGQQAVAEACRNLIAMGARPLAATDNLNFGNPEKPQVMGQLVGAIRGIGDACRALSVPIVSGNVSLYNETAGAPIQPTPSIGAVGIVEDPRDLIAGAPQAGDVAVLVGGEGSHLGQSALLAEFWGREEGPPPPMDLPAERRTGEFVLAQRRRIRAATDLSDGGLALAAFELAQRGGQGLQLTARSTAQWFGEDQARYLLALAPEEAEALLTAARAAEVPAARIGTFGGPDLALGAERAPLAELETLWRSALHPLLG